jgi:hypothetical protein
MARAACARAFSAVSPSARFRLSRVRHGGADARGRVTIIDFVSADQHELTGKTEARHAASEEETRASLRLLLERVEASEEKLDQGRA